MDIADIVPTLGTILFKKNIFSLGNPAREAIILLPIKIIENKQKNFIILFISIFPPLGKFLFFYF